MESGIKGTECNYALAFKLSVVEQIEKGEFSYKKAQRSLLEIAGEVPTHFLAPWCDLTSR
jgi:hypothetical protein